MRRAFQVTQDCLYFVVLLLAIGGSGHAGPPLTIDDPEILDPGQVEIIVASTLDKRDSGSGYEFPVLDVSYGVSTNIQVSAVAARAISNPDDGPTKSDFGTGSLGVKWRFLNRDNIQMSVAPFFETLLRDGAADRGVVEDTDAWVLPVQFQYEFEGWRLNAELGYAWIRNSDDEWSYGVAAAYPLTETIELLVEIYGNADREFDRASTLFRVGADIAVKETLHILMAIGTSIDEPGQDDLDVGAYLGLQWFR